MPNVENVLLRRRLPPASVRSLRNTLTPQQPEQLGEFCDTRTRPPACGYIHLPYYTVTAPNHCFITAHHHSRTQGVVRNRQTAREASKAGVKPSMLFDSRLCAAL